jgi:hypothetical protein
MVKLQLLFPVGFCYVWALWFFQSDLHSSVVLVALPLWLVLVFRAAGFYALLLFAARYAPQFRLWLCELVRQVVESEHENV